MTYNVFGVTLNLAQLDSTLDVADSSRMHRDAKRKACDGNVTRAVTRGHST